MLPTIVDRLLPGDHTPAPGRRPTAICLHVTDGDTAEGAISHWNGPVDASAHYLVEPTGTIVRTVHEIDIAWANGVVRNPDLTNPLIADWIRRGLNPNSQVISIERVGRPGQPIPVAQWSSLLWLVADVCLRWAIPPTRTHVIGHYQIDSVSRARCPSYTPAQWDEIVTAVARRVMLTSDDAAMEALWRAEAGDLAEKRHKSWLNRPYYQGVVLFTQEGVVAPTRALTRIVRRGLMDDAITVLEGWGHSGRFQ